MVNLVLSSILVLSIPYTPVESSNTSHKFKIGDRVKVVKHGCGTSELGMIVTIAELGQYHGSNGYKTSPPIGNTLSGYADGFIGEESFELEKSASLSKEALLEEAKRRYPIGTKYIPAHINDGLKEVVGLDCKYIIETDSIRIHSKNLKMDGYTDCVYYRGVWAGIISMPEPKTPEVTSREESQSVEEKWAVGGWVKALTNGCYPGREFIVGNYYQITNPKYSTNLIQCRSENGHKLAMDKTYEIEWIGMTKPEELYHPTPKQIDTKVEKIKEVSVNLYQPSKSKSIQF